MVAVWRRSLVGLGPLTGVHARLDSKQKTVVGVSETVPHLGRGPTRYLFTTEQLPMDARGFPDVALRGAIAHDARKTRRRALYCWGTRDFLTLAAISFHVDSQPSLPLVVTNIAVRADELNALSLFAAWMLLDVLQDVAVAAPKRADDEVGALAQNRDQGETLKRLGLRPCARPSCLTKPGTWYCYRRTRPKS
jgi:hypothetical protein